MSRKVQPVRFAGRDGRSQVQVPICQGLLSLSATPPAAPPQGPDGPQPLTDADRAYGWQVGGPASSGLAPRGHGLGRAAVAGHGLPGMQAVLPAQFHYRCQFVSVLRKSPQPPRAAQAFAQCLLQAHG